jgi:hypothetical protein
MAMSTNAHVFMAEVEVEPQCLQPLCYCTVKSPDVYCCVACEEATDTDAERCLCGHDSCAEEFGMLRTAS